MDSLVIPVPASSRQSAGTKVSANPDSLEMEIRSPGISVCSLTLCHWPSRKVQIACGWCPICCSVSKFLMRCLTTVHSNMTSMTRVKRE